MQLSVIIPAYNEQDNLSFTVEEVADCCRDLNYSYFEIIIVNDGSTDNTQSVAEGLVEKYNFVRLLTHELNLGLGCAELTGFLDAQGDWIAWFPGDGEIKPAPMLNLIKLHPDADMILGKIHKDDMLGSVWGKGHFFRAVLSSGWRFIIKILLGFDPENIVDFAFRRFLLDEVNLHSTTGLLNFEFIMKISKKDYSIVQGEIEDRIRVHGESKVTNIRTVSKTAWEILKLRIQD